MMLFSNPVSKHSQFYSELSDVWIKHIKVMSLWKKFSTISTLSSPWCNDSMCHGLYCMNWISEKVDGLLVIGLTMHVLIVSPSPCDDSVCHSMNHMNCMLEKVPVFLVVGLAVHVHGCSIDSDKFLVY